MTVMLASPTQDIEPAFGPCVYDIGYWLKERRDSRGAVVAQMQNIRDAYEGSLVIPLPEMDRNEKAAVANLVKTGLDQTARRIASTQPMLWYPPLDEASDRSKKRADVRRRATLGWWEANRMGLKLRRRAQYLIGYSCAPVLIRPDKKRGIPQWHTRDPLCTFPSETPDPDEMIPENVIFTYTKSLAWAKRAYPYQYESLRKNWQGKQDATVTLVEYVDADCTVLCLGSTGHLTAGELSTPDRPSNVMSLPRADGTISNAYTLVEIERIRNRGECCPVVIPGLINLGRPMGQFDGALPMYAMRARLQALQIIAVEKAIYPDTYLVGDGQGTEPKFIAGPFDGRTGDVNIVEGGSIIQLRDQPGSLTDMTIDRLERNERVSSYNSPEFGGESATNIRTGKRGEAVMSAQVDFGVQEAQELFAASMVEENRTAIAIAKGFFGSQRKSFYVSWKGADGHVDYVPNRDFESDANVVNFPHAGADAAGLAIGIGQRIGMGLMSAETGQELDPWITDPAREKQRVTTEALDKAVLGAVTTQAGAGAIPPHDVGRLKKLVGQGMEIEDALEQVQREAQERQASSGAVGSPDGPVAPGSPEAQPGLAAPGMGAEQPTIPAPPEGGGNFMDLLTQLRGPTRMTPAERGA